MAFSSILDEWNKWNIRGFVILSLLLQVVLILFAPFRKKTSNIRFTFPLWLAYLIADFVAAFTIGLISHNSNLCNCASEVNGALQAFWASFLLLHLGGPDTITAFSLEDSFLWRRHLLNLILEVSAAIYVFLHTFPSNNSLMTPTMLVFLAGVIKNAERLLALNLSSLPRFRESVFSQHKSSPVEYNKLFKELNVLTDGNFDEEEAKLPESIVVKHAYYFFQIFKVCLGDPDFTSEELRMSRQYFHKVSAVDALRVISVELLFFYEVLYTKALAIRSKWSYIFRFIAFIDIAMGFVLFNRVKKHSLHKIDVEITYSLLFGGIALDVIALFMLVFSDWTVAKIKLYNKGSSKRDSFLDKLISVTDNLRKPQFAKCPSELNAKITYEVLDTPLIFQRWSESIFACNLLSEYLKESPRKMYKRNRCCGIIAFSSICCFPFRLVEEIISCFHQAGETIAGGGGRGSFTYNRASMIANTKHVSKNPFIKKLWIFIFQEVRRKFEDKKEPTEEKFEARGDMFLQSSPKGIDCSYLLDYVTKAKYDFNILTWHIATEICYNREKQFTTRNDERKVSKILSDYMLYLLLNQPNVVSAVVGIAQMTSAEMLFEIWIQIRETTVDVEGLCKKLYDDPSIKELDFGSPLKTGIVLAREMDSLGERKWEVMGGVWVEMLSYAAGHIEGEAHVQVLSKGGELLAFVWLLMAHFGCFYKPEWGMSKEFSLDRQRPDEILRRMEEADERFGGTSLGSDSEGSIDEDPVKQEH